MKRSMYYLFYLLIFLACNNAELPADTETAPITFKANLIPGINESDTAYFLFYEKPGEHRLYKTAMVTSRDALQVLMQGVNDTISASKEHCVTEGKIHFYGKGEAVYTVYFNRSDSCMSLSFIHQGNKYFIPMSTAIQALLEQQAALAKKAD